MSNYTGCIFTLTPGFETIKGKLLSIESILIKKQSTLWTALPRCMYNALRHSTLVSILPFALNSNTRRITGSNGLHTGYAFSK